MFRLVCCNTNFYAYDEFTYNMFLQGMLFVNLSLHSGEFENVKVCSIHPDGCADLSGEKVW